MSASNFLREAEVLRRHVDKEERETIRRHGVRELFKETWEQMNQERKDDAFKVQQQLTSLRNEVFRFQEQLMDLRPSPDAFEKLKETMISIESSIGAFKDMQHQRFEQLLRDECLLQQEISICDQQLELWSLPQAAVCPVTQTHSLSQMHTFPKEVRALQSFLLASGGRCGGWEEQEHQRFLRIYRKCTGKAWNLSDLQQNLPGRSQEELKEHWLWTDTLNRLQQGQREAIKKWRTLRVQQQQAELKQQFENQELQERQGCLERLQLESELRRKEEKEALQAWRNQRNQEQQEKRQMHIRLITQQHRRNREEQRRREEQKLKHQEQVTRKKIKEEEEKRRVEEEQRKEREERRRLAEENIPRFQDRDRTLLNQKRQQQQNREQQQLEQQQRLQRIKSKVEVQVSRDSSRILKRTAVWQERMKLIGPSDTSGAIPLSQTYRRAVPSWRRDL